MFEAAPLKRGKLGRLLVNVPVESRSQLDEAVYAVSGEFQMVSTSAEWLRTILMPTPVLRTCTRTSVRPCDVTVVASSVSHLSPVPDWAQQKAGAKRRGGGRRCGPPMFARV